MARALAIAIAHLEFVLKTLKQAGFVISEGKTDSADSIAQTKLYLGFMIDSTTMTLQIAPEKVQDLRQALRTITQNPGRMLKAKTIAKTVGKLVAAEPALGPVVQLLSRTVQGELAAATEERGWSGWVEVSPEARESLHHMEEQLESFDGYPIKNLGTAKRLDSFVTASKETEGKEAPAQLLRIQETAYKVVVGDASAVATCALEIGQAATFFTQNELSIEERKMSSGQRELLTVLRALQQEASYFKTLKNQTIIWLTDSTNLVSFLTKGTMKADIQDQVLQVCHLLTKYQIRIVPIHLRRSDYRIQWADEGAREFDPDDWTIDSQSFKELTRVAAHGRPLCAHVQRENREILLLWTGPKNKWGGRVRAELDRRAGLGLSSSTFNHGYNEAHGEFKDDGNFSHPRLENSHFLGNYLPQRATRGNKL